MKRPKNESVKREKIYFKTVRESHENGRIDKGDVESHKYQLEDLIEGDRIIFKKVDNFQNKQEIKQNVESIKNGYSFMVPADIMNIVKIKKKITMKVDRIELKENLIDPDVEFISHLLSNHKIISDTYDISQDIDNDILFYHHQQLRSMYNNLKENTKIENKKNEFKATEEKNSGVRINLKEFIAMSFPSKDYSNLVLIGDAEVKIKNPRYY